jgi:hypothetical protein
MVLDDEGLLVHQANGHRLKGVMSTFLVPPIVCTNHFSTDDKYRANKTGGMLPRHPTT